MKEKFYRFFQDLPFETPKILFFLSLPIFLFLLLSTYFFFQLQTLETHFFYIQTLEQKEHSLIKKRIPKSNFQGTLESLLQNLPICEKEVSFLENMIKSSKEPFCLPLKKRLCFLKEKNKLCVEKGKKFSHPIEIDEADLQKILSLVEQTPIGKFSFSYLSSDVWIKNFSLIKKEPCSFSLDMEWEKKEGVEK